MEIRKPKFAAIVKFPFIGSGCRNWLSRLMSVTKQRFITSYTKHNTLHEVTEGN